MTSSDRKTASCDQDHSVNAAAELILCVSNRYRIRGPQVRGSSQLSPAKRGAIFASLPLCHPQRRLRGRRSPRRIHSILPARRSLHKVGLFFADATRSASLRAVGLNWQVQGFGTFGSVGGSGLRDVSTGGLQVYNIRNNQITSSTIVGTVGLEWQFCGIGNFGGRGASDMMLRNSNTGRLQVYNISNNQITGSAFIGTVGLDWQFSGIGNFGGRRTSDIILRNSNTGGLQVYNISNSQIT